jgi:hypothetical protein
MICVIAKNDSELLNWCLDSLELVSPPSPKGRLLGGTYLVNVIQDVCILRKEIHVKELNAFINCAKRGTKKQGKNEQIADSNHRLAKLEELHAPQHTPQ